MSYKAANKGPWRLREALRPQVPNLWSKLKTHIWNKPESSERSLTLPAMVQLTAGRRVCVRWVAFILLWRIQLNKNRKLNSHALSSPICVKVNSLFRIMDEQQDYSGSDVDDSITY